jgi:hypothetical protein
VSSGRTAVQWRPSVDDVEKIVTGVAGAEFSSTSARKPTYPRLQPKTLTVASNPALASAVGVCGNTGPAEIHLMALHWPDGAVPTLGRPVGAGVGVGVGVGVAGIGVDALGGEEDGGATVGEGDAATVQPATRHPAASPISRPLSRPTRARW